MSGITGGCLCKAVRFVCAAPPVMTRACWCRDCQYLSGGNASLSAIFRTADVAISGEVAAHDSPADSGTRMRRRFCPTCGTPLFSEALGEPEFMVVRVGALDDRAGFGPASVIWTGSAPPWAVLPPGLPHCVAQP